MLVTIYIKHNDMFGGIFADLLDLDGRRHCIDILCLVIFDDSEDRLVDWILFDCILDAEFRNGDGLIGWLFHLILYLFRCLFFINLLHWNYVYLSTGEIIKDSNLYESVLGSVGEGNNYLNCSFISVGLEIFNIPIE